jgi:hypothetical protein
MNASWVASVYPNPVTEQLCIRTISAKGSIELSDASGKRIVFAAINGPETRLDMEGLPKGNYFLRILTENGEHSTMVVKQ